MVDGVEVAVEESRSVERAVQEVLPCVHDQAVPERSEQDGPGMFGQYSQCRVKLS